MINIGIDVGAKNIKMVIFKDQAIIAKGQIPAGFETKQSIQSLYDRVLGEANINIADVSSIVATGSGKKEVTFATKAITEVTAAAKGAVTIMPSVRCVIDVGAEEGRAIRCDSEGRVVDFAINEKCAAGAGAFTEAMARALEIPIDDFGPMSLKSDKEIPMNAQCAVFAESEVVSLLHQNTDKKDIAKAINDAVASRITSMTRKVGFEKDIALIGGVSKNVGFVDSLKRGLESDILLLEDAEYIVAIGAALS